jgi:hypothetical protein
MGKEKNINGTAPQYARNPEARIVSNTLLYHRPAILNDFSTGACDGDAG